MKFYSYFAYNLGILSSIEFPWLMSKKGKGKNSDVKIISKSKNRVPQGNIVLDNPTSLSLIQHSDKDISVLLKNKPFLRVKNGNKIIVNSNLDIDPYSCRFLILNQGMGILLYQRGYLVLHGSAVDMYGGAIAFIGTTKAGKSTIAAQMDMSGHPLVTDDVLTIEFKNDIPFILPSFPILKLREDMFKRLSIKSDIFTKIDSKSKVYGYKPISDFPINPLPLKSIYLIEKSKKNEIVPLKLQNPLLELVKQSYAIRFFDNQEKTKNFYQCGNVVKNIPVKHLKILRSTTTNENVLSLIEKDMTSS